MQYTYTTIISQKDCIFYAKVPDIDSCITTGKSLQETVLLITDALNLCLTVLEDEGAAPKQSMPQTNRPHLTTDILVPIQADTDEYRKTHIT